ncbi:MAG: hypothetical protein WCI36_03735 [bacterium]
MNAYNISYYFLIVSMIIAIISRVASFGWILIFFSPIIVVYYVLIYFANNYFLDKFKDKFTTTKATIVFITCLLFIVSNLLFPDGGDGPRIVLFGFVEFYPVMMTISLVSMALASVLAVIEILWVKIKV